MGCTARGRGCPWAFGESRRTSMPPMDFDERAEVGRIRFWVEEHDGDGAFPVVRVRQTAPLRGQMQEDARVVRGDVAADQVRVVRASLMDRQRWGLSGTRRMDLTYSQLAVLRVLPGQERLFAWQGEHGQVGGERDPQAGPACDGTCRPRPGIRPGSGTALWTMTPNERSRRTRPFMMGLWLRLWQNSMPCVRGSMVPSLTSSPRTSSASAPPEALKSTSGACACRHIIPCGAAGGGGRWRGYAWPSPHRAPRAGLADAAAHGPDPRSSGPRRTSRPL